MTTISCEQQPVSELDNEQPPSSMATPSSTSANKTRGYLIALIQEDAQIRAFGSPADRNEFDEILEINGRQLCQPDAELDHSELVRHIQECIKLKNIRLRVRRRPQEAGPGADNDRRDQLDRAGIRTNGDDDEDDDDDGEGAGAGEEAEVGQVSNSRTRRSCYLLDVFVIGTNARAQLGRFFELASSQRLGSNQIDQLDLLKLTHCIRRLDEASGGINDNNCKDMTVIGSRLAAAASTSTSTSRRRSSRSGRSGTKPVRGRPTIGQRNLAANSSSNNNNSIECDCSPSGSDSKTRNPSVLGHNDGRHPGNIGDHNNNNNNNINHREAISPVCSRLSRRFARETPIGRLLSDAKLVKLVRLYDKLGQISGSQEQQLDLIDLTLLAANLANPTAPDSGATQPLGPGQQRARAAGPILQSNCQSSGARHIKSIKLSDLIQLVVAQLDWLAQNWNFQLQQQQQQPPQHDESANESLTCDLFVHLTSILCKHEFEAACHAYDLVAAQLRASRPRQPRRPPLGPAGRRTQMEPREVGEQANKLSATETIETSVEQIGADPPSERGNQFVADDQDQQSSGHCGPRANIKWVRVDKNSGQALGATIKNDQNGRVLIGRIILGGLAHSSGLLVEGDEILEVNGLQLSGRNINEVIDLLDQIQEDQLTFKISSSSSASASPPGGQQMGPANKRLLVRTLFKFEGSNHQTTTPTAAAADLLVAPCRELALSFEAGEILEIIEHQRDPNWWQARRVASPMGDPSSSSSSTSVPNDRDQRQQLIMSSVGLIPSVSLLAEAKGAGGALATAAHDTDDCHQGGDDRYRQHQSLLAELKTIHLEQRTIIRASERLVAKWFNCPRGAAWAARRSKKRLVGQSESDHWPAMDAELQGVDGGAGAVSKMDFYEQVVEISRRGLNIPGNNPSSMSSASATLSPIKRPIFLVGPKMIGQDELLGLLLKNSRFSTAISHTTRQPRGQEINGVDFYFVDRPRFEANIQADGFVEYGQYHGQYYGISVEAIQRVIDSNRICVQLVNSASIPVSRIATWGSKLKPIFIFVKPDLEQPETLCEHVRNLMNNSTISTRRKLSRRRIISRTNLTDCLKLIHEEVATIESNYLPYFDSIVTIGSLRSAYEHLLRLIDNIEHETFRWIPISWLNEPRDC